MKRTYQSLPTVEEANLETYWDVVRRLEPEFYLIRLALDETGVNPLIVPKIIRSVANLCYSGGWGKVQIILKDKRVIQILGEDSDLVETDAMV